MLRPANFNPRSPHGERPDTLHIVTPLMYFNPRSPHGERHLDEDSKRILQISIHAPRMGSDSSCCCFCRYWSISIHAPRMGSDKLCRVFCFLAIISIHAPRMGSDSTVKAYSNDRIKRSTLREPHFLYSTNACFSPIFPPLRYYFAHKKSENHSFIRIISRLGTYVLHLRLVSIPQIVEPYAVRLLVHQHFQRGTK